MEEKEIVAKTIGLSLQIQELYITIFKCTTKEQAKQYLEIIDRLDKERAELIGQLDNGKIANLYKDCKEDYRILKEWVEQED